MELEERKENENENEMRLGQYTKINLIFTYQQQKNKDIKKQNPHKNSINKIKYLEINKIVRAYTKC